MINTPIAMFVFQNIADENTTITQKETIVQYE